MTSDELKHAHKLLNNIENSVRLRAIYSEAGHIIVGIPPARAVGGFKHIEHELTLSAAEIGDQIVSVLEKRIATMQGELRELGVTTTQPLGNQ